MKYKLKENTEYIKIHGLQRSGTNYLTYLLKRNIGAEVLVNAGGWKHGHYCAPWVLDQEVHVVVMTKDPYSWLVSYYNYSKPNKTFSEFVRNQVVFGEDSGTPALYYAANPIQHWNNMYFHWSTIKINAKKLAMISYEALLKHPEEIIKQIARHFSITFDCEFFVDTNKTIVPQMNCQ